MLNRVIKTLITLFALFSISLVASIGEPRKGKVLIVCGAQVDCIRVMNAFNAVRGEIKDEVDIDLRVVGLAPTDHYSTLEGVSLLHAWGWYAKQAYSVIEPDIILTCIREMPNSSTEERNTLGLAFLGGFKSPINYLYVKETKSQSLLEFIIKHEIGHSLGAPHSHSGVMFPSVDGYDSRDRKYSFLSKVYIKQFLARFI